MIAILLLVAGFGIFGTLEVLRDLIFSPDVTDRILYLSVYAFLFGLFEAIFAISMTLAFFRLRQIKEGDIAGVFA